MKIAYVFLITVAIVASVSCNKVLLDEPMTNISPEFFPDLGGITNSGEWKFLVGQGVFNSNDDYSEVISEPFPSTPTTFKSFLLHDNVLVLDEGCTYEYSAEIAYKSSNIENVPIGVLPGVSPDTHSDYRLACLRFGLFDFTTGTTIVIAITDQKMWAHMSVNALDDPTNKPWFGYFIPVAEWNDKPGDFNGLENKFRKVSVRFDPNNKISFLIDGEIVYTDSVFNGRNWDIQYLSYDNGKEYNVTTTLNNFNPFLLIEQTGSLSPYNPTSDRSKCIGLKRPAPFDFQSFAGPKNSFPNKVDGGLEDLTYYDDVAGELLYGQGVRYKVKNIKMERVNCNKNNW